MVFAVWAVRPGVDLGATAAAFHTAKAFGLSRAGAIAARKAPALGVSPAYCRRYFQNIIRYDLGPRELAGLRRFGELAAGVGLLSPQVAA